MYKVVKCDKCHRAQITTAKGRVVCKFCGKSFKAVGEKEFKKSEDALDYLYSITTNMKVT